MTPVDFDFLRHFLKKKSGLALSADKQYLVESRLLPVARRVGAANLGALIAHLREPNSENAATEVVEAMMTNETFFFRDKMPFEHFRATMMPALLAARAATKRIRIWCTSASSGQEPYSLAMILKEMGAATEGWRIDILATDIASGVLEKARRGCYSQFEVQRGLPIGLLIKHFTQVGDQWQISPEIRAMVQYRPLNLLRDFANLGTFDIVFCRNVLIYFDEETKTGVLDRLAQVMAPDGFLALGAAETVVGLTRALKPIPDKRGLYAPDRSAGSGGGTMRSGTARLTLVANRR